MKTKFKDNDLIADEPNCHNLVVVAVEAMVLADLSKLVSFCMDLIVNATVYKD